MNFFVEHEEEYEYSIIYRSSFTFEFCTAVLVGRFKRAFHDWWRSWRRWWRGWRRKIAPSRPARCSTYPAVARPTDVGPTREAIGSNGLWPTGWVWPDGKHGVLYELGGDTVYRRATGPTWYAGVTRWADRTRPVMTQLAPSNDLLVAWMDGATCKCKRLRYALELPPAMPPGLEPVLRDHRICIGVYREQQGQLVRDRDVEVDVTGALTDVADLVGLEQPELILLNDRHEQFLICSAPGVRVVNASSRCPSLGDCYNVAVAFAQGERLCGLDETLRPLGVFRKIHMYSPPRHVPPPRGRRWTS